MAGKTMINLSRMSKIFQPMTTGLSDIGDKTEISQSHKLALACMLCCHWECGS